MDRGLSAGIAVAIALAIPATGTLAADNLDLYVGAVANAAAAVSNAETNYSNATVLVALAAQAKDAASAGRGSTADKGTAAELYEQAKKNQEAALERVKSAIKNAELHNQMLQRAIDGKQASEAGGRNEKPTGIASSTRPLEGAGR